MKNYIKRVEKLEIAAPSKKYNIIAIDGLVNNAPAPFDKHIGEPINILESKYPNAEFYIINIVEG